jgi:hypothetical protein
MKLKNINKPTPPIVGKIVAAATLLLQGIPTVIASADIISPNAKETVALVCDLLNIFVASLAVFFGTKQN